MLDTPVEKYWTIKVFQSPYKHSFYGEKSMKKRSDLSIFLISLLFLTACAKDPEVVDLSDKDAIQTVEYTESETLSNNIIMEKCSINIPENGSINNFSVYNDTIYYALDYFLKYDNPTGEKVIPAFDKRDNTQIRAYNMNDKTDTLLYQYEEERCMTVTDIQCNG